MTDTHTPKVIDDVHATDIYVATLELRSVGTSKNIFPIVKYSHHFNSEPSTVPYSYQAIMQIAEKIGAVVEQRELGEQTDQAALDDTIRQIDASLTSEEDDES